MERERPDQLAMTREMLGKSSQTEVSTFLAEALATVEKMQQFLKTPKGGQETLGELRPTKRILEQQFGLIPSRPAVSAAHLYPLRKDFLEIAMDGLKRKRPDIFRCYYDFDLGFSSFLVEVLVAENKEDVRFDEAATEYATANSSPQTTISETVGRYLRMKADDTKNAELLGKDPTGFLLTEHLLKEYRQGGFEAHISLDCVTSGAKSASNLYREVYKIAAPLFPQV